MWYAAVMRFLRRRIVLGLIFSCSLTYCIVSFLNDEDEILDNDVLISMERTHPFVWRTLQEENDFNNETDLACRNSIQGQTLIVDDRGFVCDRSDVLPTGCCNAETTETSIQYSCESCKLNSCCAIYEYCVACCLHPDKKTLLEMILGKALKENNVLLASVGDHFELCLAKCRTNSRSVQHENSYRDPHGKHCYGDNVPDGIK